MRTVLSSLRASLLAVLALKMDSTALGIQELWVHTAQAPFSYTQDPQTLSGHSLGFRLWAKPQASTHEPSSGSCLTNASPRHAPESGKALAQDFQGYQYSGPIIAGAYSLGLRTTLWLYRGAQFLRNFRRGTAFARMLPVLT